MRYLLLVLLLLISFSYSHHVGKKRIINSDEFNEIVTRKDKTLVYIWTTWSSGCHQSLEHTIPQLMETVDKGEYQLLLIAVSKNREEVDSFFLDFIGPDKGKFQYIGIRQFLSSNFPN